MRQRNMVQRNSSEFASSHKKSFPEAFVSALGGSWPIATVDAFDGNRRFRGIADMPL